MYVIGEEAVSYRKGNALHNSMPKRSPYIKPKAITAEAGHLNMSPVRLAMEEK